MKNTKKIPLFQNETSLTPDSYCAIKQAQYLPVDQCRRVTVFPTKDKCEQYCTKTGIVTCKIFRVSELATMPALNLLGALGIDIHLSEELLKQLLSERVVAKIDSECGDIASLFEVANELGVMFAGLPVKPDDEDEDQSWRKPTFSDAGQPCGFDPLFWNSPKPHIAFAGIYIPAPGNYTVGSWIYIEEGDYPPSDEYLALATGIDTCGDEEDEDESPSVMSSHSLSEVQEDILLDVDDDDYPFASSFEEEVVIQAVCRRTPRTRTMLLLLQSLEYGSKDG